MCQMVVFAKYTPYIFLANSLTEIPLVLLKFGKFINQCLIDDKLLISVGPRSFVFMRTDTLSQKVRHFEMRIPK